MTETNHRIIRQANVGRPVLKQVLVGFGGLCGLKTAPIGMTHSVQYIENTSTVTWSTIETRHDADDDDDNDDGTLRLRLVTSQCTRFVRNHSFGLGICVPCRIASLCVCVCAVSVECVFDKWSNKSPSSVFRV